MELLEINSPSEEEEEEEGNWESRLTTREGICLYTCSRGTLPSGSIVKMRIMVGRRDDRMRVEGLALRPDKARANPINDLANILSVDSIALQHGRVWERGLTDKCFAVREFIYGLKIASVSSKRILMDVGSGRGQSYNMMVEKSQFGIYILVEPDVSRAKRLVQISGGVFCDREEDMVRIARELRSLDNAIIIANMTFERIWRVDQIRMLIRRNVCGSHHLLLQHKLRAWHYLGPPG